MVKAERHWHLEGTPGLGARAATASLSATASATVLHCQWQRLRRVGGAA